MRLCRRDATRAAVRNLMLAVLVALSLLGGGKLAATKVFDTLTQSFPVQDCVNVNDEPTVQRRRATGDLCAFARERKSRVLVVQFVRGGEFGESAVRELFDSVVSLNGTASSTTIEPYDVRKHAEPDLIVEGRPSLANSRAARWKVRTSLGCNLVESRVDITEKTTGVRTTRLRLLASTLRFITSAKSISRRLFSYGCRTRKFP